MITESQSWSLSEARLTVVKPIIFRPRPRHQQRNLLRQQQPRLPRHRQAEREREAGWNKSEMAEAAQIYSYERREG